MTGARKVSPHSASNNTAFRTNAPETKTAGDKPRNTFELMMTNRIDVAEVATVIAGKDVTLRRARKSASRVAFPAMNWAVTRPAHSMAVRSAEPCPKLLDLIRRCMELLTRSLPSGGFGRLGQLLLRLRRPDGRPRGDIRGDRHEIFFVQVGDDEFHQLCRGAVARSLLHVPDLPDDVAWRASGDWRDIGHTH